MVVNIVVSKKNFPVVKEYFNKRKSPFGESSSGSYVVRYSTKFRDVYTFYSIEFLENYCHSNLYANLFYYPESEKNNNELMKIIKINTRKIDYTNNIYLPNIFPYNENEMIYIMEKWIKNHICKECKGS